MINAVVFDVYGTLFDVNSVFQVCEQLFPGKGNGISQKWRQKQIEYTWLRALMNQYTGFDVVTLDSLKYTLNHLKLQYDDTALDKLTGEYLHLKPHGEAEGALKKFQPRKLIVLSNGTEQMLHTLLENAGLAHFFAAVISVNSVKTYKPNPIIYELAVKELGIPKEQILYVSSNPWDVAGSKAFGFTVGWVNRMDNMIEELGFEPDFMAPNLLKLAEIATK